jgi:hypothetical protein
MDGGRNQILSLSIITYIFAETFDQVNIPDHFSDVAKELDAKSKAIRRDFATHRGSGGSNRESLLADFLRNYLPRKFGIDTGLIVSSDGQFSNQADLIIIDQGWNAPLYPSVANRIWLVEAVYALIEVKTSLSPNELTDGIDKCRRFKRLNRQFSKAPNAPLITDSLFILWSFESPKSETLKKNLVELINAVPISERPDFVVVPGQLVATCGSYREISVLGQPGSSHRLALEKQYGRPNLTGLVFDTVPVSECGSDSLFVWLVWLLSWLKRAGPRNSELVGYLPVDKQWGRYV